MIISNSIVYFIGLLAIAIFLCFIHAANGRLRDSAMTNARQQPIANQTIFQKHNCDVETIYSFTDQQCASICSSIGNYVSKRGICVNVLAFQTEQVKNLCDPKRGVLAYLTGNSQFGSVKLRCLTIDDGIQPSDLSKPNIFCQNGNIDINYLTSYPQLSNCQCRGDQILSIIANTNAIRSRGVCVDKKFKEFYNANSLLFDSDNTLT